MRFSTLHEAIVYTLRNGARSFQQIADEIEKLDLWRRPSDGKFPKVKQIRDRSLYKYPGLFKPLDDDRLLLIGQPSFEWKISRITYNDRGWVMPSGWKCKSRTPGLHESFFGWGHEEWLFDFDRTYNSYKYGFIEGLRTPNNKHGGNTYNIQLFTIDAIQKQKYWIGIIRNCYVLTSQEQLAAQKIFLKNGWIDECRQQLKDLGLLNTGTEKSLKELGPNVRFLKEDFTPFDPLIPVANSPYINNRDRYLLYDWDDAAKVEVDKQNSFSFKPSKPSSNITVWRKNHPEFQSKEIRQLHRKISEALYNELIKAHGSENVGCDVPSGQGTFIDMIRKDKKRFVFYEIKTYNQLRKNIREAFGQLMEYAYWIRDKDVKELVIVSDKQIDSHTKDYLSFLNDTFKIPVSYLQQKV